MQEPVLKRITVLVLLLSAVAGAAFWYLTYQGARKVTRTVSQKIDHLPHGPLPGSVNIPKGMPAPALAADGKPAALHR